MHDEHAKKVSMKLAQLTAEPAAPCAVHPKFPLPPHCHVAIPYTKMKAALVHGHGTSSVIRRRIAPSPIGRGRGVKVAALPAPTQWRRRGPVAPGEKPLTLTLSHREREHGGM